MLKDFFDSFDKINFNDLSLEELFRLDEFVTHNESVADLSKQRKKINEELANRKTSCDVRSKMHEFKTGYKAVDWRMDNLSSKQKEKIASRNKKGWDTNHAWKFHLDVIPNRNHPVTKAVSDFLIDLGVSHKISSGGENGKGMTVYVGSYDDICKLSRIIQEKFGSQISVPPVYADQVIQEYAFEPIVYGRFCPGNRGYYPKIIRGIGLYEVLDDEAKKIIKKYAKNLGLIKDDVKTVFCDRVRMVYPVFKDPNDIILTAYCSHKLYVDWYGKYYCGTDLSAFEKEFFGNKIPARGTQQRKDWDKLASFFIQEVKKYESKNEFYMQHVINAKKLYTPLDLDNVEKSNNILFENMKGSMDR